MVNEVTLIGRLGQHPESQTTPGGIAVAKFSLATDENYKQNGEWQKKTNWIDVVAWRGLADKLTEQAQKGTLLYVKGKIVKRSYQKDDEKRYVTEVVASYIRVLAKGKTENTPPPPPSPQSNSALNTTVVGDIETVLTRDDDLPF